MIKVLVSILGIKTAYDKTEIEISPQSNLKSLIAELPAENLNVLLDKDGNLRRHLVLQVNKKRILPGKAAECILENEDEIMIYLPVSGG